MKFNWSGEKAIITGGSCEPALKLAVLMISEGILPVMTYRNDNGRKKIETALAAHDGAFGLCWLDFSSEDTLQNLKQEAEQPPDYFVDFAQPSFESLIASASPEKIASFVAESISFRAGILRILTRQMLKKRSGRLLFMSSTAAGFPNPGQGFYAAVKRAGEALYKNTGIELGSKGITTVSLRAGYIDSGRGRQYTGRNEKEVINKIPLGRILTADEIAGTIMFLLSDTATGFNGTEIVMDGGLTSGK